MKRLLIFALLAVLDALAASGQAQAPTLSGISPRERVEQIWKLATEGELLTPEGWRRYSGFLLHPEPPPGNKVIRVVSNYWGVQAVLAKGSDMEVTVDYAEAGQIDSKLRYTPPPPTPFAGTGLIYHFVLAPTHWTMLMSDGKVVTGKEERTGPADWYITGSPGLPWTTVNTAIRYVLEMRQKTTDPVVKKNADQTLAKLMKLH
jgi:hypothetical protein